MKQWLSSNQKNLFYYMFGFIVMGFSVNIIKASNLGSGAWDTVTINIRYYMNLIQGIEWITIGMVSFVVSFTIMTIVILYRQRIRYLLMILPVFLAAVSIDFWNIVVFQDVIYDIVWIQVLCYIIGLILLPLGLTLVVKSGYPAFVFDELMLMLVKITKAKKITAVRFAIEFLGIAIGTVFGYLTFYQTTGGFGAVNVGSFVFTFAFTPIMAFYFKVLHVSHN